MKSQIFEKAVRALNEYLAERGAHIYDAPNKEISQIDEEYVYLANHSNSFGKYEIATGRIIMEDEE